MSALLEVKDLNIEFKTSRGILKALNGISFDVQRGEVFGIVGESGCGKTVTGLSVLRLLPRSASITNGTISFDVASVAVGKEMLLARARPDLGLREGQAIGIGLNPAKLHLFAADSGDNLLLGY